MVGISRNSLSRYENGISKVSTERINRICQKFNVSYIDIVGENKMLAPVEDYQARKYGMDSVDYTKGFVGNMVEHLVDELSTQGYHL